MNPETNQLEELQHRAGQLIRPNGEPVPDHWTVFTVGQNVVVEGYTFKVAHIGESHILEILGPAQ